MKSLVTTLLVATALVFAAPAQAQQKSAEDKAAQVAATVEGVQMPAWLLRNGARSPLVPGIELKAGDQVITGAGSRLAIKLEEGSLVRLGENGQLRFVELSPGRELFKGVINVLEGAFRFTTDVAARNRKREVSIRAAQVTTGIRGTDVWGRARAGNEIVCLIEGRVEVVAAGDAPVTLNQPLQFYRRVDGAAQPVGAVEQQQIQQWSRETEAEEGKGVLRRGGRYAVTLVSTPDRAAAVNLRNDVRTAGYPAELREEKDLFVVRVRHLPSRADAHALAEQLRGKYGVKDPQI